MPNVRLTILRLLSIPEIMITWAVRNLKNEIRYSIDANKAALQDLETRKWWLAHKALKYLPEIVTCVYLTSYAIADHIYYSNLNLAELAKSGSAIKGTFLVPWGSAPVPKESSDGFIHWNDENSRPLYPVENRVVGALIGIIPAAAKYVYKAVNHFRTRKTDV